MKLKFKDVPFRSRTELREVAYINSNSLISFYAEIQREKETEPFELLISDGRRRFFNATCETKEEAYALAESKVDELIEKFFLELSQCENICENYKVEKI